MGADKSVKDTADEEPDSFLHPSQPMFRSQEGTPLEDHQPQFITTSRDGPQGSETIGNPKDMESLMHTLETAFPTRSEPSEVNPDMLRPCSDHARPANAVRFKQQDAAPMDPRMPDGMMQASAVPLATDNFMAQDPSSPDVGHPAIPQEVMSAIAIMSRPQNCQSKCGCGCHDPPNGCDCHSGMLRGLAPNAASVSARSDPTRPDCLAQKLWCCYFCYVQMCCALGEHAFVRICGYSGCRNV